MYGIKHVNPSYGDNKSQVHVTCERGIQGMRRNTSSKSKKPFVKAL